MTDNHAALGRWPNAPLALVLAQVKFEPTPDTAPEQVVERFKQAVGSRFPLTQKLQQISIVVGPVGGPENKPPEPPQTTDAGFDLRTEAKDEAIIIQQDAFTFMTAAYVDSGDFAERWGAFMDVLFDGRELKVTRLGLRYVDFIIPSAGHVPEEYFQGLGQPPVELAQYATPQFVSNLYDFPRENNGRLRVQYYRGFGSPGLPPDIQGAVVTPARLVTRNPSDPSAVLDMDRSRPADEPMKAEAAANALLVLRGDLASSFRRIMTELADKEWGNSSTEG
ncbi:MAG: TIGR04255 family protein [Planctomycetota bacterium]